MYVPEDGEIGFSNIVGKVLELQPSESKTNIFVVAEFGNLVVSSCYLNIIPNLTRNMQPYAIIENVITDSIYRKKGFGKSVIEYAIKTAWEFDCYKVMLLTGSKEESTFRFYQSCGLESDTKTAFIARVT